jgi:hypothetical protein
MSIKYGAIEEAKARKPRAKSLIVHDGVGADRTTPEALVQRLTNLAYQNRAPSVAKAAAAELLERIAPRVKNPEQGLSAGDARKLADIYERLFTETQTA